MTLNLVTLLKRITRQDATAKKPAVARVDADPFDRLARIVRVERAREAAMIRVPVHHHAG